jgi:hypothetical protein
MSQLEKTLGELLHFEKWLASQPVPAKQVKAHYRNLIPKLRPENYADLEDYWQEREAIEAELAESLKNKRIVTRERRPR